MTVSKIEDREYTGKEIKPVPKLTYNGKTLKRGSDFSLSYTDNIKTGTAKVKITGKGSYKGTRTVSFHIVKKDAKSGSSSGTGTKKGSGLGPAPFLCPLPLRLQRLAPVLDSSLLRFSIRVSVHPQGGTLVRVTKDL